MAVDFLTKLTAAAKARGSWLCVGLDPVPDRLPNGVERTPAGIVEFCRKIVEATAGQVCAYKPNIAYFEALGADGWPALKDVIDAIPDDIPVILDAKRGDVGHTAERYAVAYYERLGVDAVTVNPYMGQDAVRPFGTWTGKGAFVLCLTSNDSAAEIQLLKADGVPLFLHVARLANEWPGVCGLVVGATRADMMAEVRKIAPKKVLLVPGVGAQGGDLERSVRLGAWPDGGGVLVSASREVLYASSGKDYAAAALAAAERLREKMRGA